LPRLAKLADAVKRSQATSLEGTWGKSVRGVNAKEDDVKIVRVEESDDSEPDEAAPVKKQAKNPAVGLRACAQCSNMLAKDKFSNKQWKNKAHARKCTDCTAINAQLNEHQDHAAPAQASAHAGHGHSHGGKPCHGHGEPEPQPTRGHGHSHGGQPCHGHG
jgi:hypothetical protein